MVLTILLGLYIITTVLCVLSIAYTLKKDLDLFDSYISDNPFVNILIYLFVFIVALIPIVNIYLAVYIDDLDF